MSREIKFRVWDEYNSMMLYDDGREQVDISFCGGKPAIIHHFTEHTIEREGIEMDVPVSDLVTTFILMQFTGKKDKKNKKEIFEGDIISGTYREGIGVESINIKTTVVVSWCENKGKWVVTELASGEQFDLYDYDPLDNIIGNIYENPELIKQ